MKKRIVAVGAVLAAAMIPSAGSAAVLTDRATRTELVEVFSPNGSITRIEAPVVQGKAASAEAVAALNEGVTPLHVTGPSENRFDIVIMGDGYTQDELDLFHEHAVDKWSTVAGVEPFSTYLNFFNVWLVDVVSPESGVDNDPRPPTMRDTALDMQFWCNGTERLLCVNQTKANQFAALAPEADQILVLANSTKYGGAGGRLATSSGGNVASGQITVHELGHSIGGLADEYDYYYRAGLAENSNEDVRIPAPYVLYVGSEPSGVNVSAAQHEEMLAQQIKWWRWLGEDSPDGTPVSTYEGGGYYRMGLYRPTEDSLMKSLGKPFNLPSREEMTKAFYAFADPIDGVTTLDTDTGRVVILDLVEPVGHDLSVEWFLDGTEIESAEDSVEVELPSEDSLSGSVLEARVVDGTEFVRNPDYIAEFLTQTITVPLD